MPSYWAHSINVAKTANAFHSLGHKIELIAPASMRCAFMKKKLGNLSLHYGISENLTMKWLKPSLYAYFSDRTFQDEKFSSNAASYARKKEFDLVYCRSYLIPYCTVKLGVPTLVESHTNLFDNPDMQVLYRIAKDDSFKALVTIHESIKVEHIRRGVPAEKILVLEDGVDIERFDLDDNSRVWRKHLGLNLDKNYAVYCGQLFKGKGIEFLLKVAQQMQKNKSLTFLLIGGMKKDIIHWKKYCSIEKINNVIFTGFVTNSEVPKYLKAADCLLMPYDPEIVSTFDYGTTSPLKLFEYMAAQRPIVATNLNTINKVVRNGADAILVDIGDIDGFCQAIENLIHNVSLGRKMSENAFIKVRKYTWNQRCKKILEHVGYS